MQAPNQTLDKIYQARAAGAMQRGGPGPAGQDVGVRSRIKNNTQVGPVASLFRPGP